MYPAIVTGKLDPNQRLEEENRQGVYGPCQVFLPVTLKTVSRRNGGSCPREDKRNAKTFLAK
jgi:hypothetical protein